MTRLLAIGALLVAALLLGSACFVYTRTPFGAVMSYYWTKPLPLAGRITSGGFVGPITDEAHHFVVYLPDGYDGGDRRYPTLYHLHGFGPRDWGDAEGMLGLETNRLAHAMEREIARGTMPPAIIVSPFDGHGNTMWSDSRDGTMRAETAVVRELVPFIDARYRTRAERSQRVIQGFSMGGFGATKNSVKYPDLFGVCVGWDPALPDWAFLMGSRRWIAEPVFAGDEGHWEEHSPWRFASENASRVRGATAFRTNVGLLGDYNRRYRAHLESLDIPVDYIQTSCPHDLFCLIDAVGAETFAFIGERLGANP